MSPHTTILTRAAAVTVAAAARGSRKPVMRTTIHRAAVAAAAFCLTAGTFILGGATQAVAQDQVAYAYVSNGLTDSVTGYAMEATGNVTPVATIQGSNTGLSVPGGLVFNSSGDLFVANASAPNGQTSFGSVTEYAPGANGNVTPIATISGSNTGLYGPTGLALDASGDLFVTNGYGGLTEYAPGANGNVTPIATIQEGLSTGLDGGEGVAVDCSGDVFVADSGTSPGSVTEYAPGATGSPAPIATISGSNAGLQDTTGLAFDSSGDLLVANGTDPSYVSEFAPGANGNVAPIATISGSNTGLVGAGGLALDSQGDLFAANMFGGGGRGSVTEYASGASGNAAPIATISGSNTALGLPDFVALVPPRDGDLCIGHTASVTTNATGASGATVTYSLPTVKDPDDTAVPAPVCDHPSGTVFPIGTTTVKCTATDSDDTPSTVSTTFTVTVVIPPLAFTPSRHNFGPVIVGQTASQKFTLKNNTSTATSALTVSTAGSATFTITAGTCAGISLQPDKTCTVTVQFAPTATGTRRGTLQAAGTAAAATAQLAGTGAPAGHLYWANDAGTISEVPLAGGPVTTLVSGQNGPVGVAVDGSHLYWADSGAGTIDEANRDGTGGVTTLATGQNYPGGVAVDSSHIYWANYIAGTINEAPLAGGPATTLVSGQTHPHGVAVYGSHLYWANECDANCQQNTGTINEVPLAGGTATTLVSGLFGPLGVAVNSSHLYWTEVGGVINEAPRAGGTATTLVTRQGDPWGIAVDGSHLYWANYDGSGTIDQANLDGTGITTLVTGQNQSEGLAVSPT